MWFSIHALSPNSFFNIIIRSFVSPEHYTSVGYKALKWKEMMFANVFLCRAKSAAGVGKFPLLWVTGSSNWLTNESDNDCHTWLPLLYSTQYIISFQFVASLTYLSASKWTGAFPIPCSFAKLVRDLSIYWSEQTKHT